MTSKKYSLQTSSPLLYRQKVPKFGIQWEKNSTKSQQSSIQSQFFFPLHVQFFQLPRINFSWFRDPIIVFLNILLMIDIDTIGSLKTNANFIIFYAFSYVKIYSELYFHYINKYVELSLCQQFIGLRPGRKNFPTLIFAILSQLLSATISSTRI